MTYSYLFYEFKENFAKYYIVLCSNNVNVKIQMATEEQKYLSDIIKNTHATLRQEAQNCGPEIAWERHIRRKDILQV